MSGAVLSPDVAAAGHVRIHAPQIGPDTLKVGTPAHKKAVLYFQRWADLMSDNYEKLMDERSVFAELRATLESTADGILVVTAKEQVSGVEASIEVKPSYGLTGSFAPAGADG